MGGLNEINKCGIYDSTFHVVLGSVRATHYLYDILISMISVNLTPQGVLLMK